MSDIDTGAPVASEGGEPGIRILAQFIRDLSMENPRAPDALRAAQDQPQIDLGVDMNARGRDDGLFEVDLKLSARANRSDGPLFVVELLYGGVFQIGGVPPEEMEPVLLIECPRYLFPFARRIIAEVTSEGGFPPFLRDPIDFAGVYAARKAQAEEQVGHALDSQTPLIPATAGIQAESAVRGYAAPIRKRRLGPRLRGDERILLSSYSPNRAHSVSPFTASRMKAAWAARSSLVENTSSGRGLGPYSARAATTAAAVISAVESSRRRSRPPFSSR